MNLVIVESAAKAKTIEKYLNEIPELKHVGKFKVIASFGHVQDLPEKEIGIDTTSWTVTYMPIKTKGDIIKKLKKARTEATMVYLASDLDLEGNAIAYHLKNILKLKKGEYYRVVFNEITKEALKGAFLKPGDIDMNMFSAQETRRILDRIVGFELSPLLWRRFATQSLSAGRVQTAGLQMIIGRFKNANEHIPETYLTCEGIFKIKKDAIELSANLCTSDNDKIVHWPTQRHSECDNKEQFEEFLKKLISHCDCHCHSTSGWDCEYTQKKVLKNPSAPFTTSTFQQEVYNLYHIPPKVAMQSAQRLYESGHITYMRTDSVQLSDDAHKSLQKFITKTYGNEIYCNRVFKTKQANAQEAHEAIRPSDPLFNGSELIDATDRKIYSLIWRRTIASQMIPAEYLEIHYTIKLPFKSEYYFHGKVSFLIKEGYLLVYSPDSTIDKVGLEIWKNIKKGTVFPVSLKGVPNLTKSQSLFNESTIIKAFEKEGIGRPSTYAAIIDKLYTRKYIEKGECPQKDVDSCQYNWKKGEKEYTRDGVVLTSGSKEKDFLLPTSLGMRVLTYLQPIVPFIVEPVFTSHMETDLDKIMNGTANKKTVLDDFYKIFHAAVIKAQEDSKAVSKTKPPKTEANKVYPKEESIIHKYTTDLVVVKTKYGAALLKVSTSKWFSIQPFMEWKNKKYSDVTPEDIQFIMSLPVNIHSTDKNLCMGPHGLYIKDSYGNNYILPKEHWDNAYRNIFDVGFIQSLQQVQKSKKPALQKKNK
jgi:DNA topoisomerase-1